MKDEDMSDHTEEEGESIDVDQSGELANEDDGELLGRFQHHVNLHSEENPDLRRIFQSLLGLLESWINSEVADFPDADVFENLNDVQMKGRLKIKPETTPEEIVDCVRRFHYLKLLDVKIEIENIENDLNNHCKAQLATFFAKVAAKQESLYYHLKSTMYDRYSSTLNTKQFQKNGLFIFSAFIPKSSQPAVMRMTELMIHELNILGYKKYQGNVMEEIFLRDGQIKTHAYRILCSIENFVTNQCSATKNPEAYALWCKNVEARCCKALKDLEDFRFPELKPDRHVFSFNDGIMMLKMRDEEDGEYYQMWCPYLSEAHLGLQSDLVSANYFPVDANIENFVENPQMAPTPYFDQIFLNQGLPVDALHDLYALFGRFMYDVNEMDEWDVFLFLYGRAGTGKSTATRVVELIYPEEDICYLSDTARPTFVLPPNIFDVKIIVYPETATQTNIKTTVLQQIICGERMTVHVMYSEGKIGNVIGHMIAHGNQFSATSDIAGSMGRRTIVIYFSKMITNKDCALEDKLKSELSYLIWKWNDAYHTLVHNVEGRDVWECLHPQFREWKNFMRGEMNSIHAFFDAKVGTALMEGPTMFLSEEDFNQLFKEFCTQRGYGRQKLTINFVESALNDRGYRYEIMTMQGQPVRVIVGVGLRQNVFQQGQGNFGNNPRNQGQMQMQTQSTTSRH
jgi:hypothetical protein